MKATLLTTLLFMVAACDCPEVKYEIKNEGSTLACKGYDDKFRYDGEYCTIVSCTWYCNNYRDYQCAYVDLTFMSCDDSDGWYLDSSYIEEDGICD